MFYKSFQKPVCWYGFISLPINSSSSTPKHFNYDDACNFPFIVDFHIFSYLSTNDTRNTYTKIGENIVNSSSIVDAKFMTRTRFSFTLSWTSSYGLQIKRSWTKFLCFSLKSSCWIDKTRQTRFMPKRSWLFVTILRLFLCMRVRCLLASS